MNSVVISSAVAMRENRGEQDSEEGLEQFAEVG